MFYNRFEKSALFVVSIQAVKRTENASKFHNSLVTQANP
jgi:hypothetical protein